MELENRNVAAMNAVQMVRGHIEEVAGPDLDRLADALDDQKAFARVARAIIRDLSMGDDLSDAPDQPEQDEEDGGHGRAGAGRWG